MYKKLTVYSGITRVRNVDSHAIENPYIISDSSMLSWLSVATGAWFQNPQRIPKSMNAQVPYIKWCRSMYTVNPAHLWTPNWVSKTVPESTENNPHISEPMQVKLVLYKCQLSMSLPSEFFQVCQVGLMFENKVI